MPTTPKKPFFKVATFSEFYTYIGRSMPSSYLFAYLSHEDIEAKTLVIENYYIDKDYLLDYSNYYSRSFNDISKFTKRVHIFSEEFGEDDFENLLSGL
jgi:predicted patatin/cPLA2 family phospholipase